MVLTSRAATTQHIASRWEHDISRLSDVKRDPASLDAQTAHERLLQGKLP